MVTLDGDPWFVAKDVCDTLALTSKSGGQDALRPLASDEYRYVSRSTLGQIKVSFPNRGANCVSESGLYKLVMRSDKPEARDFQDWVTRVVLPSIRKDGARRALEVVWAGRVPSEQQRPLSGPQMGAGYPGCLRC